MLINNQAPMVLPYDRAIDLAFTLNKMTIGTIMLKLTRLRARPKSRYSMVKLN
jgi:hypothetical protein